MGRRVGNRRETVLGGGSYGKGSNSAPNFALAKKLAINIFDNDKGKKSLVTKGLEAGWGTDYLLILLTI